MWPRGCDSLRVKQMKVFHLQRRDVGLIMVFVPAAVRSQDAAVVLLLPPVAFWLGGVAEAVGGFRK